MDGSQRNLRVLVAVLLTSALVCICLGSRSYSPAQVARLMTGAGDETQRMILLGFRLPRVLLAGLVGVGLGVSGLLMQCSLRNDLADPGMMGVSAGSSLGIMAAFVLGGVMSPWTLPAISMLCAMATVLLVCLLAHEEPAPSPTRLLLTGVAVSAAISAATLVVSLQVDRRAYAQAVAWAAGSFAKSDWNYVTALAIFLGLALPALWSLHAIMDVLRLRDDAATALGVSVPFWRMSVLLAGVGTGAASMSVVGSMAFVGLLAPHIGRRLAGPSHSRALPASALVGSTVVVVADTLGRTVFQPVEVPAGVIASALGGCYFLCLLMTSRG
ncbi:MAG: iron ABC transporter permease [Planctomycetales bacterium]|nr:iron ABC transporter permease [Planctomycetales bacterium]